MERPKNPRGMVVAAADFGFSPESADNTAALNRALAFCREKNAAKLELAPGSYRFTADASIMLDGMRDFELDGKGAKFIFLRTEKESFLINDCERLLLRNLSCDWDWAADPPASVVEVMRTDPGTVDFKFVEYDRFPRRDVRVSVLSCYDPFPVRSESRMDLTVCILSRKPGWRTTFCGFRSATPASMCPAVFL